MCPQNLLEVLPTSPNIEKRPGLLIALYFPKHHSTLIQDTIFKELRNTAENDPQFAQYNDTAPYLLKLKKTQSDI